MLDATSTRHGMNELLRIERLQKYFPFVQGLLRRKVSYVRAVDYVDISISCGETFAVVGESGSGKTTLGKTAIRILEPTSGEIWFKGREISNLKGAELKLFRRQAQMVFQDTTTSLNPRRRIRDILTDPLEIHHVGNRAQQLQTATELLRLVEMPEEYLYKHPYALSGGEKQRVVIARALACNPDFLVLDEPTSSLDVSVQAKILALLKKLQRDLGLTYLLISHDMSLVKNTSDKVAIMYLGRIVETAQVDELFARPLHPYTRALLSAIPVVSDDELSILPEKIVLEREQPRLIEVPEGCRFNTRCWKKFHLCEKTEPELTQYSKDHLVACHLYATQPVTERQSIARN